MFLSRDRQGIGALGFSYVYRPPTAVRRYFVERFNLDCYSRIVDTPQADPYD